ncbi:hypothetical protein ACXGQW_00195 [Wenyingzhuangia sp. IMCC45533]
MPGHTFVNAEYSFKYCFDISQVATEWVKLNSNNTYLTYSYLNALQNSIVKDVTFIYVLVYKKNRVVGQLYFQWITVKNDFFNQKKFPQQIKSKLRAYLLKTLNGSLLLCGNFFATGTHGFFFSEKVSTNIIYEIIKKMRFSLRTNNNFPAINFVMVKEFWQNNNVAVQKELYKKAAKFQIDVNMVLEINPEWLSFEDYLNDMKTKYRTRAKNVIKRTIDITSKEFDVSEIEHYQSEIHELYNAVLKTASFNMIRLSENSFGLLKKELGNKFVFKGYFKNETLVGFSTACTNKSYLDANYVGIDYAVNNEQPLYQKILYDFVTEAIAKRKKELRLGRTAEIIKSTLGAKPKEMYLYIKHTNPFLHIVLKPLTKYVKPSNYEIREPFKVKQSR